MFTQSKKKYLTFGLLKSLLIKPLKMQNKIFSSPGRYIFAVVIFILLSVSCSGQNNNQDLSGIRKYNALMQNDASYFKGKNNPVEMVFWNSAVEFCRKLSLKSGMTMRPPTRMGKAVSR